MSGDYVTLRGKWRTSNAKEQRRKPVQTATALRTADLVLGRYRPLRPLGSGGSGSVWLVRDEDAGRDVALKVVERTGKAGSRAKREVEAATRLRHPRCLRALAFHRDEGHVYVAYEYVRGQNLRESLRAGKVDDATAIEVAAQVLDALAHAHAKGIVHRDVKPANVMVEECEEVSTRLLDFGLARLDELEGLTATGDVPGTLAYVAPGATGRRARRRRGRRVGGGSDALGGSRRLASVCRHLARGDSPADRGGRAAAGDGAARPAARSSARRSTRCFRSSPGAAHPPGDSRPTCGQAANFERDRPHSAASRTALRERAAHALLAAVAAGGATTLLPFFPRGWPLVLAALAGVAALRSPVAGLAVALAAPVLPLGNLSLGLAVAYGVLAVTWLTLYARDAERSLLPVAAPLLAPFGAIPLLPIALLEARGRIPAGRGRCRLHSARSRSLPCWPVDRFRSPESHLALRLPVAGSTDPLDVMVTPLQRTHSAFDPRSRDRCPRARRRVRRPRRLPWALGDRGWGAALLAGALLAPAAFGVSPPVPFPPRSSSGPEPCLLALRGHRSADSDPAGVGQNARAG